ncbi:cupin domain-containing protein [Mycobacterium shimoidei]|uniref:Cupin 2 barrel domain-containing protein [Alicycliphilus denitrificans K601] n=1 Tax=Mycobacterium shimoidei TaxID=29313 RepID=A0A1E3TLL7_MYCSH|nr:cupin domain-containing protein [Mycobacterium shimoidei]MCV7258736.1 cupin domain-containing protein [Mycobacterium shimoidei]ODR15350.1 glucose-6-phosphate isomerase [Mycobacterium shimoidei]ORW79929.1 glucose-6-phosphate isomerase [Mycobacterium shimoidei]SRX92798.1 cupin 2 barrel domain-containing protein [Alicycliphilus denitrificans K601] [Mycobacterium shimoidei]
MNQGTLPKVFAPEDIVWHETNLGESFWISEELVGTDYSTLFSAQLTKFGPGGGSTPHHHDYNHAFYFLTGTCRVQIGDQSWQTKPGTLVKVPANDEHSLVNTGDDDLVFLVIYDPPHVATD